MRHFWNDVFLPLLAEASPYVTVPIVFLLWLLTLWLVKRIVIARLKKWAATTMHRWDDVLVDAISFPVNFLILASGLTLLTLLMKQKQNLPEVICL